MHSYLYRYIHTSLHLENNSVHFLNLHLVEWKQQQQDGDNIKIRAQPIYKFIDGISQRRNKPDRSVLAYKCITCVISQSAQSDTTCY